MKYILLILILSILLFYKTEVCNLEETNQKIIDNVRGMKVGDVMTIDNSSFKKIKWTK